MTDPKYPNLSWIILNRRTGDVHWDECQRALEEIRDLRKQVAVLQMQMANLDLHSLDTFDELGDY